MWEERDPLSGWTGLRDIALFSSFFLSLVFFLLLLFLLFFFAYGWFFEFVMRVCPYICIHVSRGGGVYGVEACYLRRRVWCGESGIATVVLIIRTVTLAIMHAITGHSTEYGSQYLVYGCRTFTD